MGLILNRKCYQVFKPEMEFKMMNIIYVALRMCMHAEKTTFSRKDHYCKALHIYVCPKKILLSPPKKRIKYIKNQKMAMLELHTAPALSRLCGILLHRMHKCVKKIYDSKYLMGTLLTEKNTVLNAQQKRGKK